MPLVFSYGTLQQENVQLSTFGRLLRGERDELLRFEPSLVKIEDPQAAAAIGRTHHANVTCNGRDDSRVEGTVFEITAAELAAADQYEASASYKRISTTLASGKQAWVYVYASMRQSIAHVALVVRDYDEAISFFTQTLNFVLLEDRYQPAEDKRWVVVAPPGSRGTTLLLARASEQEQERFVGNQTGGRVFLFLSTDDFWRDYNEMTGRGIRFIRPPSEQPYGVVAVFEDLYGNRWDLIQYAGDQPYN